ncbi:hypothetical protein N7456_000232 [Penicillium angulare]|uniref:Uncharacterized protein n=1 Tax=Penicillium angulare TaxID=116970 RepID=A0A9W9GBS6_9EURO|nr:hypothetical protein N7456_000232 [Penicillium angulare]
MRRYRAEETGQQFEPNITRMYPAIDRLLCDVDNLPDHAEVLDKTVQKICKAAGMGDNVKTVDLAEILSRTDGGDDIEFAKLKMALGMALQGLLAKESLKD